jgi:hypothetical protein
MRVITICWDPDNGEATINFAGLDRLHGIEKMDFLDDAIALLTDKQEEIVPKCFEDYR